MSTCQAIFCSAPWRATAGGHGQAVSPYANNHQLRLRPRNAFAFRHLTSLRLGDDPETGGGLDGRTTRSSPWRSALRGFFEPRNYPTQLFRCSQDILCCSLFQGRDLLFAPAATHAVVPEPYALSLGNVKNVPGIDQQVASHVFLDAPKIQVAKLIPFCPDHDSIRTLDRFIAVGTECNAVALQDPTSLRHPGR